MSSMSGYCTLTATSVPSSRRARVHLRERGRGDRRLVRTRENTAPSGLPSSRSTAARTTAKGFGGTASWHCFSFSTNAGGKTSARVAIAWHSLDDHAAQVGARWRGSASAARSCVRRQLGLGGLRQPPQLPAPLGQLVERGRGAAARRATIAVRWRRVSGCTRQAAAAGSGSKPVRSGGVQRDSSASNSSSSACGFAAVCIASIRLSRMSSRCSRGRFRVISRRMRWSSAVHHLAAGERAAVDGAQRARAELRERRAQVLDVRLLVALHEAHHVASRLRRGRDLGIREQLDAPLEGALGEHLDHQHLRHQREHALERLVELRERALGARGRARAAPIMRISTSPGILGFSSARSRAASHICLWPPSSWKPDSSRACASKRPSREVRERGALDRLDDERAQVGHLHVADDRAEALDDRDDGERAHDRVAHAVLQQQRRLRHVRVLRRHQRARDLDQRVRRRARGAPARRRSRGRGAACAASDSGRRPRSRRGSARRPR